MTGAAADSEAWGPAEPADHPQIGASANATSTQPFEMRWFIGRTYLVNT
jgi:hypothetical protein